MRKFVSVGVLIFVLAMTAAAADVPKFELFGGISWLHIDDMNSPAITGIAVRKNYPGWDTALQFNMNRWLGIKGDISGHYGPPVSGGPSGSSHSFLFGPQITRRGEHARPFAHALFGINRVSISGFSDSTFAMAFGGGLDAKINDRFAVRIGQLDWLYTRHDATGIGLKDHQSNIKYAGGIVIGF